MEQPYYITDNRTLYIKCDCASAAQIRSAFDEALTKYETEHREHLNCRFRVNLVENKEGISFGISFVFVTNPAVYHMLLGKNADGSDRVEYRDDPSWTPPIPGDNVNDAGWSTISEPVFTETKSWADMMDEEDEYQAKVEAEKQKYVCPKIAVPLEPLMVLPPYRLTPYQVDEKREKIIDENEGKPDFNPELVEIPPTAYFTVEPALAKPVEPKFMANILKCKGVPPWITKEDLKVQFSPYVSDGETPQERYIKGRRVEETYPFVNINDDRVAFVIFDPSTPDALFALHMMKKTIISKKMPDSSVNKVTLIFAHSFRTDRDMMADISQRPRPVQRRDNPPPRDGDGYRGRGGYGGGGGGGGGRGRGGYGGGGSRFSERRDEGPREIHRSPPKPSEPSPQPEGKNRFSALGANGFAALIEEDDD
jgi:uncharacterized membrane protein YgcG